VNVRVERKLERASVCEGGVAKDRRSRGEGWQEDSGNRDKGKRQAGEWQLKGDGRVQGEEGKRRKKRKLQRAQKHLHSITGQAKDQKCTCIQHSSPALPHIDSVVVDEDKERRRQPYFLTAASEREPTTRLPNTGRTWEQVRLYSQFYFSDIEDQKAERCTVRDKGGPQDKPSMHCCPSCMCSSHAIIHGRSSKHSRSIEHTLHPHLAPMEEYAYIILSIIDHHIQPPILRHHQRSIYIHVVCCICLHPLFCSTFGQDRENFAHIRSSILSPCLQLQPSRRWPVSSWSAPTFVFFPCPLHNAVWPNMFSLTCLAIIFSLAWLATLMIEIRDCASIVKRRPKSV